MHYLVIDEEFDFANFLVRHWLVLGKVEARLVRVDERALLLHVRTQHFAQGFVHDVSDRVVAHGAHAQGRVHPRLDLIANFHRARFEHAVVPEDLGLDLLRVGDREGAAGRHQFPLVAYLAAGLGVERRGIQHHDGLLP